MATTLTINGQEYVIEKGTGGYTYYRTSQAQRFGKAVKAKNGVLLVWNGTDGTPNPELGLSGLTWGLGSTYVPLVDPDISAGVHSYESVDNFYGDDFVFGDDGNKLYLITVGTKDVKEYSLSAPYDLSSPATLTYTYGIYPELPGVGGTPNGISFNQNGSKMYHQDSGQRRIWVHTLSTPWDLSTVSFDTTYFFFDDNGTVPLLGHQWCDSGSKIVIGCLLSSLDKVRIYDVNTPYDVTTVDSNSVIELDVSADLLDYAEDVYIGNAGYKLQVLDKDGYLVQYDLSSAYDISTASNKQVLDVREHPTISNMQSFDFNADYTKLYVLGQGLDHINCFDV